MRVEQRAGDGRKEDVKEEREGNDGAGDGEKGENVRYEPAEESKVDAEREIVRLRKRWFAKRKGLGVLLREAITKEEVPLLDTDAAGKTDECDGALAALGAGAVRTQTGSYMIAFLASGAACIMASLLVLRIARRPVLVAAE